jgi:L-ribulokinase
MIGLEICEESLDIYNEMHKFIEGADWLVLKLCGNYLRNITTAGYKGIYQDEKYPTEEYLNELNPNFSNFVKDKLENTIGQLGDLAGKLTKEASIWTGLNEGIAVSVGNCDAHVVCAAANAVSNGQMVAIMGTSTCLVMVSDTLAIVPGMCGVVKGGIVPDLLGYEAGQSGVGDIFSWFVRNFVPIKYHNQAKERDIDIHTLLSQLGKDIPVGGHGLIALDWHNGNRSTLVDHRLSGMFIGLTLQSSVEEMYKALIESTAYGMRKIIETFNNNNVRVTDFIAAGGLIKNEFVMQIYADILNLPIKVIRSKEASALGSAIHAAVSSGYYANIQEAASKMGGISDVVYYPNDNNCSIYNELYQHYNYLYDLFGSNHTMHSLRSIRDRVLLSSSTNENNNDTVEQLVSVCNIGFISLPIENGLTMVSIVIRNDNLSPWEMHEEPPQQARVALLAANFSEEAENGFSIMLSVDATDALLIELGYVHCDLADVAGFGVI